MDSIMLEGDGLALFLLSTYHLVQAEHGAQVDSSLDRWPMES